MQDEDENQNYSSHTGTAMTAAAWIIVLIFLFTMFGSLITQRNNPNQDIVTTSIDGQKIVRLQRNPQGHYLANGTINERNVVFLLDTGATDVAIPESLANVIGLKKGRVLTIKTANGNAKAYRTHLNSVAIGDIKRYDLNATVLMNMEGSEVLLGMSFLKHFEMIQKGKTLTIKQ